MNIWAVMHRNINKNLLRLLTAQAQAEETGKVSFPCPVCGGRAVWIRKEKYNMTCLCIGCGMYLGVDLGETM